MDDDVGHKIGALVSDVLSTIESLKSQVEALQALQTSLATQIKAGSDRATALEGRETTLENAVKELQSHHEDHGGPGLQFRF